MANNPSEGPSDDFFDQILGFPAYNGAEPNLAGNDAGAIPPAMMLQLNSGDGSGQFSGVGLGVGLGGGGGFHGHGGAASFPLGLSLEQGKGGFLKMDDGSAPGRRFRDDVVDSRASSSVKPVTIAISFLAFLVFCDILFLFLGKLSPFLCKLIYCVSKKLSLKSCHLS